MKIDLNRICPRTSPTLVLKTLALNREATNELHVSVSEL